MIFLERMWKGHRQSDQHWNCFKGNTGETPETERQGRAHGISQAHRSIQSWTELNWIQLIQMIEPFHCQWNNESSESERKQNNNKNSPVWVRISLPKSLSYLVPWPFVDNSTYVEFSHCCQFFVSSSINISQSIRDMHPYRLPETVKDKSFCNKASWSRLTVDTR